KQHCMLQRIHLDAIRPLEHRMPARRRRLDLVLHPRVPGEDGDAGQDDDGQEGDQYGEMHHGEGLVVADGWLSSHSVPNLENLTIVIPAKDGIQCGRSGKLSKSTASEVQKMNSNPRRNDE